MRRIVLVAALAIATPGCFIDPGGSGGSGGGDSGGSGSGGAGSANADAHQRHCLDTLNAYRAQAGVAPLELDDQLSAFSLKASEELQATGQPHGYFQAQGQSGAIWTQGFCNSAAENQAPGWPINGDEDGTIDAILKAMMDEGPGGGHHDNILAASSTRVGVGLIVDAQQQLWFSNDFSGACR